MLQADPMDSGDHHTGAKGYEFVNRPKGLRRVSLRSICKLLLAAAIVGWIFLLVIALLALAVAHTVRWVLQQRRRHQRFRHFSIGSGPLPGGALGGQNL